eukprot:14896064-Alexandrium_andersonii.AAC.1
MGSRGATTSPGARCNQGQRKETTQAHHKSPRPRGARETPSRNSCVSTGLPSPGARNASCST